MKAGGPPYRCWGLPLLREMRADYLGFVQRLQREHGDLTRMRIVNEDAWDVMSPELVREALVTHADSLIRWERGIAVFEQVFGQSVLVTEGDAWQRQRRMLMPAFSPRRVAGYAQLMTDAAKSALDAAVPAGQADGLVAMDTLWNDVAMDVILRTLFSESAQSDARDAAWATQTLSAAAFREMFMPFTLPDWLPLPGKATKRCALKALRELVQRHIDARQPDAASRGVQTPEERTDLLHMLLALRDDATGEPLSPQEVFDQCMVSFQAGHETSATALLWWSRLMAEHPETARRAQAEVDAVLQGGTPGPEHMAKLPWLTATLKEALRLYPPVAALMTRRTTAPITLGGVAIPRGAMLRITPWVLHRDERWFAQADHFVPERFLDGAAPIEKGAWIPFGVGPRVCIGQHFAMLEMTLLAALLLQRYTIVLPAGAAPSAPKLNVTLRPATPVILRLEKR
ncbi:cytochrome P450 [Acidovorax sp. NCPPB 4044]|uniref:cytochrome P450 n=1 Tax=Acidovorax sp. NCPPB 4044 TaxID=2940490 RepID=UPI002304AF7C|nr:cytochrome P450 [Acidovorax sp. NCPPB 4044]MDA8523700.1 cytochrome P450 [Acidovorax sp. NCPPB 4044]